jgi:hypothetical protein
MRKEYQHFGFEKPIKLVLKELGGNIPVILSSTPSYEEVLVE